ncbi:MAG: DHA2 family efflux MFS transporter permease subunit [Pyrinomonadaceae bacterium]
MSVKLAYKWKVMIVVAVGIWMIVLDSTVINVAFPTLRHEFSASVDNTQWVISIYVLALGIATPLAGILADRLGLKRIYIAGLSLFVLGSLLSGFASSLWLLISARALQGLGGGIAQPLAVALLFMTFPLREQGRAFGIFGVVMVAAPALGPILGGLLVDLSPWRWIFFINIPIGLLGIALAAKLLHPSQTAQTTNFNPLRVIPVVLGFGSVLIGASRVSQYGWGSQLVLGSLAIGAVALCTFAIVELKLVQQPLLDLRLFRNRTFLTASLVGYVAVIALFGAEFLMPVYLQSLRGRTALQSGVILLPLAIVAGIINPIAGRLYDKIGPRILVVIGSVVLLVNTWQFAGLQASTCIDRILVLLGLRGLAISLIMQATITTALGSVPRDAVPRGSSVVNSTRFVAQALGVALLATIMASAISPEVKQFEQQNQSGTALERFGLCENTSAEVASIPTNNVSAIHRACEESLSGLRRAYVVTFCAAAVALLLGLLLPGWPSDWDGGGDLSSVEQRRQTDTARVFSERAPSLTSIEQETAIQRSTGQKNPSTLLATVRSHTAMSNSNRFAGDERGTKLFDGDITTTQH